MNPEEKRPVETQSENHQAHPQHTDVFYMIKRVTAWVMIISATMFALVGVLAVWEVLGESAGDVVWRAFASLAIIAFASLIVNVASRIAIAKQ